jgi:hypothetical protein
MHCVPAEKKFRARAACPPLARAHAATRLKFGLPPTFHFANTPERNILTPAHKRVLAAQPAQLRSQNESGAKKFFEFLPAQPFTQEPLKLCFTPGGGESRNLAFTDCGVHSPDSRRFTGAINTLN